jgi:hypothetical protein
MSGPLAVSSFDAAVHREACADDKQRQQELVSLAVGDSQKNNARCGLSCVKRSKMRRSGGTIAPFHATEVINILKEKQSVAGGQ